MLKKGIFLVAILVSLQSFAKIQVHPLKVFLDQKRKTDSVTVKNLSDQKVSYKISTVHFEQNEKGQMRLKKEVPESSLTPLVRFSPRVVTLSPGEHQVVRLMVRNISSLPETGDFRTHLRFEQTRSSFEKKEEGPLSDGEVRTNLKVNLAISIPLFFRKGLPDYKVKLTDLKIIPDSPSGPKFNVTMENNGSSYPYGRFELYTVSEGEKQELIGEVNGAQSFVKKREFIYPISGNKSALKNHNQNSYLLEFISMREEQEEVLANVKTSD